MSGKEYTTELLKLEDAQVEKLQDIEDEIIHVNIDSDHNSILIGKNGRTLQALIPCLITSLFKVGSVPG